MKTVKISLEVNALDGYLYGGRLFLVTKDGLLKYIPVVDIFNNLSTESEEYKFLSLIFDRNNWLINKQAKRIFKIELINTSFIKTWNKFSNKEFNFKIRDEDLKVLSSLDTMPMYDFRIYGMRLFLGNRNGLHEAGITLRSEKEVVLNEKIHRVFDSRITSISPNYGTLMLSSNVDGLFHGSFKGVNERIEVRKNAVVPISVRTSWTGYNVVNYLDQNQFDYLENEYVLEEKRKKLYSKDDEGSKKQVKFTKIASNTLSMDDVINKTKIEDEEILFAFNSSQACFFIMSNGDLINSNWISSSKNSANSNRLSSRIYNIGKVIKGRNKKYDHPLSSHFIPKGCVIEFFDRIILVQNSKLNTLENKAVTSIRTYPASIRYRNLVTLFDGSSVDIHAIYPSETK